MIKFFEYLLIAVVLVTMVIIFPTFILTAFVSGIMNIAAGSIVVGSLWIIAGLLVLVGTIGAGAAITMGEFDDWPEDTAVKIVERLDNGKH